MNIKEDNAPFKKLTFSNINVLLYFKKVSENSCEVYNYKEAKIAYGITIDEDIKYIPEGYALSMIDALDCDNVNIDNYIILALQLL